MKLFVPRHLVTTKYEPHQGKRERLRRLKQALKGHHVVRDTVSKFPLSESQLMAAYFDLVRSS